MHREHNFMCVAAFNANWTCVYNRPWPLTLDRGRRLIGYGLGRCWLNSNMNCTHVFVKIHKQVLLLLFNTKKPLCEPLKLCLDEFGSCTHTAMRRQICLRAREVKYLMHQRDGLCASHGLWEAATPPPPSSCGRSGSVTLPAHSAPPITAASAAAANVRMDQCKS